MIFILYDLYEVSPYASTPNSNRIVHVVVDTDIEISTL